MKNINWKKLITAIGICFGAAVIGSMATIQKIPNWYANLEKPFFSPPNWLFGPVWTLLYGLMGVSLYLVWNSKSKVKGEALHWFGRQLILNAAWSVLFFGLENPGIALAGITVLWWAIRKTIIVFGKINKTAQGLLVPYLAWVSFALVLNGGIWWLNR